eukprot:TRINITY_DN106334_c0_g1_i1.p1 TRINITY_DN106334_c0_g1~~TRINITY_DN106334_c0_g1_i1.p1  ORF type:complete len:333 (+),score=33.08 TRINITY_DN106334_c0_g1_i1:38-1036(+)
MEDWEQANFAHYSETIRFEHFEGIPSGAVLEDSPQTLKVVTFNVYGVDADEKFSFRSERLPHIIRTLQQLNADVMCIQECSQAVVDALYHQFKDSYFFAELTDLKQKWVKDRNITCEAYIISRIKPTQITFNALGPMKAYCPSSTVCEFKDFVVLNNHLRAGDASRARIEQIGYVSELIEMYQAQGKCVILAGDFNFHLDGEVEQWPETDAVKQMKQKYNMRDVWETCCPSEVGATESTSQNLMRWNLKQKNKEYRYDAIFCSTEYEPESVALVGVSPIFLLSAEQEALFMEEHVNKKGLCIDKLRCDDDGKLQWWPSDHFGLVCKLKIKTQ